VASFDNKLYALNPDGTLKWSYATGNYVYSSPAIGSDGTIYVASFDNNLYAINDNGPPFISNLSVAGDTNGPFSITWDQSNTTSVDITYTSTQPSVTGTFSDTTLTSSTFTLDYLSSYPNTDLDFTITLTNSHGSTTSNVTQNIYCFLGFVKLETSTGPVAIENIHPGTLMLQPNGTYSKAVRINKSTACGPHRDTRLFADESGKCVVTYWHRLRVGDQEEVRAIDNTLLHEVTHEFPFDIFNIELEEGSHKLIVADTEIVAEGLIANHPLNKQYANE
jgi:hypothetical protein